MKEVVTYVAFDDTEFDNEEECRKYEAAHIKSMDKFHGFNSKGKPIVFNEKEETIMDFYERLSNEAFYFNIEERPSDDLYEFFRYTIGIELPPATGWWRYDFNTYEWCRLKEEVMQLFDTWRAVIPDDLLIEIALKK